VSKPWCSHTATWIISAGWRPWPNASANPASSWCCTRAPLDRTPDAGAGLHLHPLHPSAFRQNRYIKADAATHIGLPSLQREMLAAAGVNAVESAGPKMLLDGSLLFLGEIPRRTDFEKGFPRMCYDDNGREKKDPIEDDTAIAFHLRGKGLAVISGCAHSGIVNTLYYARELTGIDSIFLVMGGFHLTGKDFEPVITPTINALKTLQPTYVVPTHCTGRKATQRIEAEMPQQFLLNMSGTRMTFKA